MEKKSIKKNKIKVKKERKEIMWLAKEKSADLLKSVPLESGKKSGYWGKMGVKNTDTEKKSKCK